MILHALLFFCFFAGTSAEVKVRVIAVAEGSDMSLNCTSSMDQSLWLSHKPNTRIKLNTTEYLLINNFQSQDVGYYDCKNGTHRQTFYLELKAGSTNKNLIFFRASEKDSVFFFCKALRSSSSKAEWYWTPYNSFYKIQLYPKSDHYKNHLQFRNKDNDFSLKISPVKWSDSGKYHCQINFSSEIKMSVFELVLVKVHADPQVNHGINLKCDLSYKPPNVSVLWINTKTRETFSNPLHVKDIAPNQQNWMCGIFHNSMLKAVFPITLNITRAFTTTPPSPTTPGPTSCTEPETPTHTAANNITVNPDTDHNISHTSFFIIGVIIAFIFITVIFISVALFTGVCCTKTAVDRTETMTYAEVKFRKKSGDSTEYHLNFSDVPAEETEVVYATVHLS